MCDTFEKLLNDSLIKIYDKYKDIDDSAGCVVDINLSEEGSLSLEGASSEDELFGAEDENFSFIKRKASVPGTQKYMLRDLDFDLLYGFLFRIDSIDDLLYLIDKVDPL